MRELLMVRYGEIYLKGLNRPYFMKMFTKRVQDALKGTGASAWLHDSRLLVCDIADMDECVRRVSRVFGVHSVCPAVEMEKDDFAAICERAADMMKDTRGTFKVSARRADKRYPMDSPQINAAVGEYILDHCQGLTVNVKRPEHILNIEIRDWVYLYTRVVPGVGGMPVGTGGRATLLLSGGIDSPVAGYMIAKRGVQISAVHFYSFPYTSVQAKEKVLTLAKILSEYCCGMRVYVVPFTDIQMKIHELCPEDYTTLIMRRYMMRIASRVAAIERAEALVTGESLGQVASQTMEALGVTNSVAGMPVFRPLIGFDKTDIIAVAEKIGTLETSNLPYEDCCTVFTPRHPATHPKMEKIALGEGRLDEEALISAAMEGIEIIDV